MTEKTKTKTPTHPPKRRGPHNTRKTLPRNAEAAGRKRLSDKKKAALIAKYYEIRKSGTNAEKAAKAVGFHYNTILKWENQAGKPKVAKIASKTKTKKTAVGNRATGQNANQKKGRKRTAATTKTNDVVLVTPDGFRIEGIAPRDLVRVIKELK